MKLIIQQIPIEILDYEYLEYHDGKDGHNFALDCSIMGIRSKERAEELKTLLTELYSFKRYPMEPIEIAIINGSIEVLFALGDFHPIIAP